MKIFFLINSAYPRYAGGIETWLHNVSNRLCKEHDITIVSHDINNYPLMFSNISKEIKIHKFKTLRSYSLLRPFIRSYIVLLDLFIGSYAMGHVLKKILPKNEKCFIIHLSCLQHWI